ncbi:aldo/keto reductase [Corynebacterium poyangense]|uniref:Aldo/keto reductase n=1 Tax=Corynebacterium poyangense TaxID=2684405 RepID=A0A7H0SLP1_9CORY|nr:aldo/keto reductase [Corynebacterium poyangense]MBZ8177572.1 aldo/keto reductase [Corynebacterium poyangense]QNQ89466.1 aldo/keto reductase [Corynebacterium poyangense]
MLYTRLPNTDIEVSKICLGGMSFGEKVSDWHQWIIGQKETTTVIERAFELGINFIDTANVYAHGTSEKLIGQAIKELGINREKIVLASKVFFNEGGSSANAIHREIEGSLKRLGVDYLDLYILHRFDYNTPIEETLAALHQLVKSGKVRAIGASEMYAYQFHHMIHALEQNGWTPFSTMQCHYNLLYREDERELLPLCDEYGILPTPYSPLASGHLTRPQWNSGSVRSKTDNTMKNKYDAGKNLDQPVIERVKILSDRYGIPMSQVALAWQWSHRAASPIVGCSKPERVDQAVAALNLNLSKEDITYLEEPYQAHNVVGPASRPGEKPNAGSHKNTETK